MYSIVTARHPFSLEKGSQDVSIRLTMQSFYHELQPYTYTVHVAT